MFEQTFKNLDDVLRKEAGCSTELDYAEQTSWLLFLKYLDDFERDRALEAKLTGKKYKRLIDQEHRWSIWAAPKTKGGEFDHDNALAGEDLVEFVDDDLFPYLEGFRGRAESPDSIEYKVGEIFGEVRSKFRSGYLLRDETNNIKSTVGRDGAGICPARYGCDHPRPFGRRLGVEHHLQ